MFGRSSIFAIALATLTLAGGASADSEETPFSLSVSSAKAKVGTATNFSVTVTATSGYHSNEQYPHKIKGLSGDDGVSLGATKVDGAVQGGKIVFSVPVTPKTAGAHKVTGEARFSVCSDTQCVIKKVPISATVTGE